MTMSIPFERYDEEFASLTEQVQQAINSLQNDIESSPSGKSSSSPESDLKFASSLLSQCDDLIKQMSVEARGVDDVSTKRDLLQKVRVCKAKLDNLRDDYNAAKTQVERESLLSTSDRNGGVSSSSGLSNDHRERLLKTSDRIEAQNKTLENARRVMSETEEVALEITEELGRNREKIKSAHGRVRDVSGLTNRARRIVQNMSRREVQQKLVVYVTALVLVIVFFVILFNLR